MKTAIAIIVLFVVSFLGMGYGAYYVMNGLKGGMASENGNTSSARKTKYGRQPRKSKSSNSMRDQSLFTWKRGKSSR